MIPKIPTDTFAAFEAFWFEPMQHLLCPFIAFSSSMVYFLGDEHKSDQCRNAIRFKSAKQKCHGPQVMTHGEGVNIQAKTEGKILKLCVLASRAIQKFLFGEMHLLRGIVFSILLC